MAVRIPPPPNIVYADPAFNRWLLEITSILEKGANGGINPDEIAGVQNDVAALTKQIADLQASIKVLQQAIGITNARLRSGTVKPPDIQGTDGDWFAVTAGAQRGVYVRVASVWTLIAN